MKRSALALLLLAALAGAALAGEISVGATMQVRPNAIWFQEEEQFARWQALKRSGDKKAFAAYEKEVLGARDAWRFIYALPVRILGYVPEKSRVEVEMTSPGRMNGTQWIIDAAAIER